MGYIELALCLLIPVMAFVGGIYYSNLPPAAQDRRIEETLEEIIEWKTGEDIDLSPDTPEEFHGEK